MAICFSLLKHEMRFDLSLAWASAGSSMATMMGIIRNPTTTKDETCDGLPLPFETSARVVDLTQGDDAKDERENRADDWQKACETENAEHETGNCKA